MIGIYRLKATNYHLTILFGLNLYNYHPPPQHTGTKLKFSFQLSCPRTLDAEPWVSLQYAVSVNSQVAAPLLNA